VLGGDEPYFSRGPAGHWTGVCIKLADEFARSLGAVLEPVETAPAHALSEVANDRLDLVYRFDPMAKTPAGVEWTRPLFNDAYGLLTRGRFDPKSWAALDVPQSLIAFDRGSPQAAIVRRLAGDATITGFRTRDEAIGAVLSGRSDGLVASILVALLARRQHPQLAAPVLPTPKAAVPIVLGVKADADHRLRDKVNAWCAENRGNGKMRAWILAVLARFGIQPEEIPPKVAL
jgi:polar amino acid transport system substrate-binding protein